MIRVYIVLHLRKPDFVAWEQQMHRPDPLPGRVAQSITCLATDACLTAGRSRDREFDPGLVPYFRGD